MDFLNFFIVFLEQHANLAYLLLFLGSFFETLIGPGFFIYGEFIFLAGSILAGLGYFNIWLVSLVCIAGGIVGDSSSFFIGKKYGKQLIKGFFKKKNKYLNEKNYKKGVSFFGKYGEKSIFFARFLGPLSWVTPFIAGSADLKYKRFLLFNIPGVIFGISQFLIVGYFFGFSYIAFLSRIKAGIFYLMLGLFIALFFIILRKYISSKKVPFN